MKILFQTLMIVLMFSHVEASEDAGKKSIDPLKTKEQFEKIITRVTDLYAPTIKDLGYDFKIAMDWEDDTENASADKPRETNVWRITLYGGYFRTLTNDAFALVICHELGHLLAGAPYVPGTKLSVEGQADFWASSVCLKKYFNTYPEKAGKLSLSIKENCDRVNSDDQSRNTCYLVSKAGLNLAKNHNRSIHEPDIDLPDNRIINNLDPYHPNAQCRLDTYLAGSLCTPQDTTFAFQKKLLNENLLSDSLCRINLGYKTSNIELRPTCWFKEDKYEMIYSTYERSVGETDFEQITIYYANYIPGEYKIKIVIDEESSKYVTIETDSQAEYELNNLIGKNQGEFSFNEKEYTIKLSEYDRSYILGFKYKIKRQLRSKLINFYLLVERDGKIINNREYKMQVFAKSRLRS